MERLTLLALALMIVTLPFEETARLGELGSLSKVIGLGATALALMAIVRRASIRRPHPGLLFLTGWAVWAATSTLWSIHVGDSLTRTTTLAQLLVFAFMTFELTRSRAAANTLIRAYLVGCVIGMVDASYVAITTPETLTNARYSATNMNPNNFGMTLIVGLALGARLVFTDPNRRGRILAVAYTLLSIMTIVLTGSRGSLVTLVFLAVTVPMFLGQESLQRRILIAAGIAVAIFGAISLAPEYLSERLLATQDELLHGRMSGRRQIWEVSIDVFGSSPLWGSGIGASRWAIERSFGKASVAHNTYLSVLLDTGLVGLSFFILGLFALFLPLLRQRAFSAKLDVLVLASWCLASLAASPEYTKVAWFVFAMTAAAAEMPEEEEATEEEAQTHEPPENPNPDLASAVGP